MDKEIKVTIPNVRLSDLERLVKKSRSIVGEEDVEISFEFIIASLFPTSWKNIQAELSRQYTKGYIQGRIDKEEEINEYRNHDDDPDCYCE